MALQLGLTLDPHKNELFNVSIRHANNILYIIFIHPQNTDCENGISCECFVTISAHVVSL